jgi:hypothetical protein
MAVSDAETAAKFERVEPPVFLNFPDSRPPNSGEVAIQKAGAQVHYHPDAG